MNTQPWRWHGIAGAVLALGLSAVTAAGDAAAAPDGPAPVVAPATVQAYFSTDLYAKEAGYVAKVNADIGDHVRAGQVLAVIDNPELRQEAAKAQAALAQATAGLTMAKREFEALQAEQALESITLRRQEELFAGKAVTEQQIDEARAKAQVQAAQVGVGRAHVAAAGADLRTAVAEQRRLQALLGYTQIVAPFDGVVTRRSLNPGDLVQAATASRSAPLFTCAKLDIVRIFADVPEANAITIRPGTAANIQVGGAAGPDTLHAVVTRSAGALDPATRTMHVEIDLPNADGRLVPGMYVQVTLNPGAKAP